jgi:murein DD-endopeptidase MepM/ murein hydrolase activator NlpD
MNTRSSIPMGSFVGRLSSRKGPKITTSMIDGPVSATGTFSPAEQTELTSIKTSLQKLLVIEKQQYDQLGDRILRTARESERERLQSKENQAEANKPKSKDDAKKNPVVKGALSGLDKLFGFFGDLIKWFVGYKIVEWVSKKENLKKVQNFSKLFLGIIKFVSTVVGFGVDKLLGGIDKLVNGDGVSKAFGVLEAVVGFFTLKWLANPLKIISDIKGIAGLFTKTIPSTINGIINFFTNLIPTAATQAVDNAVKEGFKGADAWAKNFPKEAAAHAAKQAAGQATEQAAKTGGKTVAKVAAGGVAKAAGKGAAKVGGKSLIKKIPVLGAIASGFFAVDRASKGDWLGAGMEVASGGASLIPGFGTAASIGIDAALIARDIAKENNKKELPKLAKGGIVTKPTKAIVGEAGPEAILPLDKLSSFSGKGFSKDVNKVIPDFMKLLTLPFKIVGATIIGMTSMIPGIGPLVLPLISSVASMFGVPQSIVQGFNKAKGFAVSKFQETGKSIAKLFGEKPPIISKKGGSSFSPSGDNSVRGLLGNILSALISKNGSETTTPSEPPTPPGTGTPSPDSGSPKVGGSAKPLPQNASLAKAGDAKVQNVAGTVEDLKSKGYNYVSGTDNRFFQDDQGRLYEAKTTRNNTSLASMMGVGKDIYSLRAVTQDQIDKGFTHAGDPSTVGNKNQQQIQRQLELFRIINKGGTLEKETTGTQTQIKENGKWQTKAPGGKIDGVGQGDKIHALLEPQEYVLNRNAVKGMGGPGVLDKINFGMFPRFASGGHVVTSMPFQNRNIPGVSSGMHMGADVGANYEPLKAYIDGEVLQTSPPASAAGYGPKWVVWKGSDGRGHMFAHMSQVFVKKGDKLRKGRKIGISGSAGTGPHLHWEVSTNPADVGQDKSSKRSRLNPIAIFGSEAPFGGDIKPGEGSTDVAGKSQSGAEPGGETVDYANVAKMLGQLYKGLSGTKVPEAPSLPPAAAPSPTPSKSPQSLNSAQRTNNNVMSNLYSRSSGGNVVNLNDPNKVITQSSTQPIVATLGNTLPSTPLTLFPLNP